MSEFDRAVKEEFGELEGAAVVRDVVIGDLNDRTAAQAIADGEPARDVWLALCEVMQVPLARRHGVGRIAPKR